MMFMFELPPQVAMAIAPGVVVWVWLYVPLIRSSAAVLVTIPPLEIVPPTVVVDPVALYSLLVLALLITNVPTTDATCPDPV